MKAAETYIHFTAARREQPVPKGTNMSKSKIFAAAILVALGQAAIASTGATANAGESFTLHPAPVSQSSLTRAEVRAGLVAARQVTAPTDIWTAPDGGNPARVAGTSARPDTSTLGGAPAPSAARPADMKVHQVFVGNVD